MKKGIKFIGALFVFIFFVYSLFIAPFLEFKYKGSVLGFMAVIAIVLCIVYKMFFFKSDE